MPNTLRTMSLASAMTAIAFAAQAACGTLELFSPAETHQAHFNDMDGNGEVSVGDTLVGQRALENGIGQPMAELFFVGTVQELDTQTGVALRPTKYVYAFEDGTFFGAQDFDLPVSDFQDPPGRTLASSTHSVNILGGTGAYANARGVVNFALNQTGDGLYDIVFDCDLAGTWVGETVIMLESEGEIVAAPRIHTIVIEEVDGNLVHGFRTWRSPEDQDPGYVGEIATTDASEPFIGSLSADGDRLHLVEFEDHGMLIGEVLGPDMIEFTYMEAAPHAVVYTAIYHRQ